MLKRFSTFSSFSNWIPIMCETKKYVFTGNSRAETWRLQFSRDLTLRQFLVIFAHRNFTETVSVKLLCSTTTCLLNYRMMHWNRDCAINSQNFGKFSTYNTPFHFENKNSISIGVDLKLYDKFTLIMKSLTSDTLINKRSPHITCDGHKDLKKQVLPISFCPSNPLYFFTMYVFLFPYIQLIDVFIILRV